MLIRNNEQFEQNLHHITFFNFFLSNKISKGKVIYLTFLFFLFKCLLYMPIYIIYWFQKLYYLVSVFVVS